MRRTALLIVLATLVAACVTSPTGRRQLKLVSDAQVDQMGVSSFQELKKKEPATKDTAQAKYVQCVANGIVRQIPTMNWNVRIPTSWEVVTFESKEVNAFALPGGKIGVYTGLLKVATTQDQLAAVIGHEVSHVLAGHSAERVSDQMVAQLGVTVAQAAGGSGQLASIAGQTFFLLPFSRAHETEADLLGMDLMSKAGFDPRQAITLWQNMQKNAGGNAPPEMMSTHPSSSTRIQNLNERLSKDLPVYEAARAAGLRPNCS